MRKIAYLLAGAVLGGVTGSVLVFLFTPAPGAQIRNRIKENLLHLSQEIRLAAEERRIELNEQLARLRAPMQNT